MLIVLSDRPAHHCLFSDSALTLICKADLLNGLAKKNQAETVAAALAARYRELGDSFVNGLRGTFSIILLRSSQQGFEGLDRPVWFRAAFCFVNAPNGFWFRATFN